MAKKTESKSEKAGKPAAAVKRKAVTKPAKVPQQAENFEHTIRRAIRERERERSEKFGLYL